MNLKTILSLVAVLIISSCGNKENNQLIIGTWQGTQWLIGNSTSGRNAEETKFTFDEKERYTFTYAGTVEKGTYKVENKMLFTTAEGEHEMMVQIAKLNADTMIFDMNRGGQTERLTLLREK